MIRITTGDILKDEAEALVNTVNCVGVMGRGVALQFKNAFHDNFEAYARACEAGEVRPGRMFVRGRVLDPVGKPVKGAALDLVARPRKTWVGASADDGQFSLFGFGQSDASGRFHLEVPRTRSAGFRNHSGSFDLMALAAAPGFGVGWAELNPDAQQPGGDIRLRPEQTAHVKLVDLSGLPAHFARLFLALM